MSKNVIVKGALILLIANIVVRIIGAIFRIPLARLLGDDGMGLFSAAHNIYTLVLLVVSAGFPIAISKMVAEATAKGHEREAKRIFYVSLAILSILGAAGTAALYFGAGWFANLIANSRTVLGLMAISPAVLLVAVASAYRGYFQGKQNMFPTALSQVMEAMGRLFIGYAIAAFMLNRWDYVHGAAGALYGVAAGSALSVILLFVTYLWDKRNQKSQPKPAKTAPTRKIRTITKELLWLAAPITIGAAAQSLIMFIDTFTITPLLQTIPGVTEADANRYFGRYSGFVLPVANLVPGLMIALFTPIVPAISAALTLGDKPKSHRIAQNYMRITMILALPAAVGLWMLADPIITTIFPDPPPGTGQLLALLTPTIALMALHAVTTAILQGHGRMGLPVIFLAIGALVKGVLNYTLIPILGISAAPIATNVCYALIVLLNIVAIMKVTRIKFNIIELLIKPVAASGILALVAIFSYQFIANLGISVRLSTLAAIMLAGVVYLIALFLLKAIKEEDIRSLPKGDRLANKLFK